MTKNKAAVKLGKLGGKKGGPARAAKLTKEERSAIAKKAARARWAKHRLTVKYDCTLYDDDSTRKKFLVMDKWNVMMDDGRNPETDMLEQVEEFLEFGKSYKITLHIEEK